jgi:hypothetical protein
LVSQAALRNETLKGSLTPTFQKKSKTGIKTPTDEIDTIKTRLKAAEADYEEFRQKSQNGEEETKLS